MKGNLGEEMVLLMRPIGLQGREHGRVRGILVTAEKREMREKRA